MIDRTGQQLDHYRLIRALGSGAFGEVYLAEDTHRKTQVAVKILRSSLDEHNIADFLMEARTFRLEHPHILRIRDFGVEEGFPFIVMDYISQGNLRQRHPRGTRIRLDIVISYAKQIAGALQSIHDEGLVHRDVKPENMLVGSNDTILLSDFGIVTTSFTIDLGHSQLPRGTPSYIAPEQINGQAVRASDQYALGVVIYEWLAGELPFQGTMDEVLRQQFVVDPESLLRAVPMLSSKVDAVVMKALSKEPKDRFATVQEFALALEQAAHISDMVDIEPLEPVQQEVQEASEQLAEADASSPPLLNQSPSTMMFSDIALSSDERKDFFISYNRANLSWATWIAQQLEDAGYSVLLPPWGLRSDSTIDLEMRKALAKAKRIIVVLSPVYINILNAQYVWIDTFKKYTADEPSILIPICVEEGGRKFRKALESINYIDIAKVDEVTAQAILLAGVRNEGIRLTKRIAFPTTISRYSLDTPPSDFRALASTQHTLTQLSRSKKGTEDKTQQQQLQATQYTEGIKIFLSYSHKDERLRDQLDMQLSTLRRQGLITWHDREIGPGKVWSQEIDAHLSIATIILLLISPEFIHSEYCYIHEMEQALERHEAGEARVIPIILRPTDLEGTPLEKLQALPRDARPVTSWRRREDALHDVVKGIRRALRELIPET